MRSQGNVNSAELNKVAECIRVHGTVTVARGVQYESDLDRVLQVTGLTRAEKVEAVERLVEAGKVRQVESTVKLGKGGISDPKPVVEKVFVISMNG